MKVIKEKLSSNNLKERIIYSSILLLVVFLLVVIVSYYFLPEGFLKNKNPLQAWDASNNSIILALQIFIYNLISVVVILIASLFSQKKEDESNYLSIGYSAFYTLIVINGLVLGTWSFSVEIQAVSLLERIVMLFDITRKAALWEMFGQLLITCAIAHISIVKISGIDSKKSSFKEIKLKESEKTAIIIGIFLMVIGAVVESLVIVQL